MRLTLPIISICACIIINSSCATRRMTKAGFSEINKPTVTFKPRNANQLSDAEDMIAFHFISTDLKYLPKYVDVSYFSVSKRYDTLYSNLKNWNKTKLNFSRKRQYRLYADAAGTNHLLDLEIKYVSNHMKYKLKYIDGSSGKTFWKMKLRWPSLLFGSRKKNPDLLMKKKFIKKFPYKSATS